MTDEDRARREAKRAIDAARRAHARGDLAAFEANYDRAKAALEQLEAALNEKERRK